MRLCLGLLFAVSSPVVLHAETLIAARTVRSNTVLTADDVVVGQHSVPGALKDAGSAIGLETRVVLYAGRSIRPEDIGPVTVIDRNQVISLVFKSNGLTILAEGRALGRGGVGDTLRVMNISSRTTVTGRIAENGHVLVGQ
ncbi:flagellar basal body P-ring formation chaperone FlgA [Pseudogemmobacter sp. W21_MBD1_M6]|uniref:flagellar basal body P-ring formation chaperone FlgA n=1 Tax=Pseudogemmobacter sp. W21_MBD1_M6 TaxID=3240271 RepID=UPI003F970A1A